MSELKIKVKVGVHEFEAQGEEAVVLKLYDEFKGQIEQEKSNPPPAQPITPPATEINPLVAALSAAAGGQIAADASAQANSARLNKIVRNDGKRPITLSALPRGDGREGDAALILLLAYKVLWQEDEMAAARLLDGLEQSGYKVGRIDRLMDRFIEGQERMVLRTGVRRGVRYRLTTIGLARAWALVDELVATVG